MAKIVLGIGTSHTPLLTFDPGLWENYARRVVVGIESRQAENGFMRSLAEILQPFREGHCRICIDYLGGSAAARVALGDDWTVHPTDELLHRLQELAGEERVAVEYT